MVLGAIIVVAAAFVVGYDKGKRGAEAAVVKQETKVQVEERIVYKDRIVTKTVIKIQKPDGTVITKETDKVEEADKTTDIKKDDIRLVTSPSPKAAQDTYMIGVYKGLKLDLSPSFDEGVEVTVGRRIFGGFWLNTGYSTIKRSPDTPDTALLGISYSW